MWKVGARHSSEAKEKMKVARRNAKKTPLEERFWSKVDKNGPVPTHRPELGPCWLWTGATRGGYGNIKVDGKGLGAHRVSHEMEHGPLDPLADVCHACDNTRCVRPSHLFLGTAKENAQDMMAKARHPQARGEYAGEANPNCRLSDEQVQAIIAARKEGGVSQREIGLAYGVSQSHVSHLERVGRRSEGQVER